MKKMSEIRKLPTAMRAVVTNGNMDISLQQMEIRRPQAYEVVVKVRRCGICGSDIPRVLHHVCPVYPTVLGHEFSGEVVAVGEKATRVRPGARVAGIPLVPCMNCAPCRAGCYGQCASFSFIGTKQNGAFAEYVTVPQTNVYVLDDAIDWVQGAFFEPVTVALHALGQLPKPFGGKLAILGAGTIGLMVLQCARALGFEEVTVFDMDEHRLQLARELGAHTLVNTRDEERVRRLRKEAAAGDLRLQVMECAGVEDTIRLALALAPWRATVVFVGIPTRDVCLTPQDFDAISRRELTMRGSWMSYSNHFPGQEWDVAAQLFRDGKIRTDVLLEETISLEDVPELFRQIQNGRKLNGKIVIQL